MRHQRAVLRRLVVAAWVRALEWPGARVRALVSCQVGEVRARVAAAGVVAYGLHTPGRPSAGVWTVTACQSDGARGWLTGFSPVCRRWWRRSAPLSALRYEQPGWAQTNGSARGSTTLPTTPAAVPMCGAILTIAAVRALVARHVVHAVGRIVAAGMRTRQRRRRGRAHGREGHGRAASKARLYAVPRAWPRLTRQTLAMSLSFSVVFWKLVDWRR